MGQQQPIARERRTTDRRALYPGEACGVQVSYDNGVVFEGTAVDVSHRGMGILCEQRHLETPPPIQRDADLSYALHDGTPMETRVRVVSCRASVVRKRHYWRLGVEFIKQKKQEPAACAWFACSESYRAVAWASDPLFFGETLHFVVDAFSPSGMLLRPQGGLSSLLPGITFVIKICLPALGVFQAGIKLHTLQEKDGAVLAEVHFTDPSNELLLKISEYLLLSGNVTSTASLRSSGFPVGAIASALSFGYAESPHERATIRAFRKGKFDEESIAAQTAHTPESDLFADRFDAFSRQIVCRVGGRIIACARLVFVEKSKERSEFEKILKGELPVFIWQHKFLEVSRFVCCPDYKSSDIFVAFMQQFARIAIESRHPYLLTLCPTALLPVYCKLGFVSLTQKFGHGKLCALNDSHVMWLDVCSVLCRDTPINESTWKKVYAEVADFLGFTPPLPQSTAK